MATYKKVDKIEFFYDSTDLDSDDINFTIKIGNQEVHRTLEYDEIPLYAVLYYKVDLHEDYTSIVEISPYRYDSFRITNNDDGTVTLDIIIEDISVYCDFTRDNLLDMLKKPILQAAADPDYMELKFGLDEDDELNEDEKEQYEKEYAAYIDMLEKQVLPDFVWKEVQKYNMSNPENVYKRHMAITATKEEEV